MKKTITALSVIIVLILTSCGGEKMNNPLIGKWKLKDINLPKVDITSEVNTQADTMGITGVDTAIKTMAKGMESMTNAMSGMGEALANSFLKGSTYEFKDDGTLKVSILFGSQKGKYTISADNKDLKTTVEGKEQSYKVTTVNEKELILTTETGEAWTFEAK
jgi:hypothetical protein